MSESGVQGFETWRATIHYAVFVILFGPVAGLIKLSLQGSCCLFVQVVQHQPFANLSWCSSLGIVGVA